MELSQHLTDLLKIQLQIERFTFLNQHMKGVGSLVGNSERTD